MFSKSAYSLARAARPTPLHLGWMENCLPFSNWAGNSRGLSVAQRKQHTNRREHPPEVLGDPHTRPIRSGLTWSVDSRLRNSSFLQ